ncbi:hypothetical protein HPB52_010409 [Rhipicephalus sanguineus]|uniref:Uncharacterized protein n=1 Tax=Rhipicephalus sanguineus TaxID=34632 RepID=A0A9D4Q5Z6_RHISA|nr:hypothetical protein HPB52_010409 [Rhipicephalus sanguineus]
MMLTSTIFRGLQNGTLGATPEGITNSGDHLGLPKRMSSCEATRSRPMALARQGNTRAYHPTVLLVDAAASRERSIDLIWRLEAKRSPKLRLLTSARHSGLRPTVLLAENARRPPPRRNATVATAWLFTRPPPLALTARFPSSSLVRVPKSIVIFISAQAPHHLLQHPVRVTHKRRPSQRSTPMLQMLNGLRYRLEQ